MKTLKSSSLTGVLFLVALFLFNSGVARAQQQVSLTDDDCVKCHAVPPADLKAAGGKHKEVGCTGCHAGHPPTVKKPIPQCSDCHMGKPHFELKGCLNCHKNPHTPLKISFTPTITDACLTCHAQQIEQLRKYKSKHTALDCSKCHDVHRKIPQCTQCHKPHSAAMVAADCKKCHKPHMPAVVTYSADTPSKDCGACHSKILNLLSASKAKHSALACASCHKEKHKMVPQCQDCHGSPHPAGIMAKFPKCGECHNIAHDLNNWPATTAQEAPKKAPNEKPKGKSRSRR
jgi:hypothetical protein